MINYIQATDISKRIGDIVLFNELSFNADGGDKIGIVAVNGAGKSSLLDILSGRESPDTGNIIRRKGTTIGYLRQETDLDLTRTVFDEVFSSDNNALRLIREYEEVLDAGDHQKLHLIMQKIDDIKAWDYEVRVKQILTQLDLPDHSAIVGSLSGGQQKRVELAKVLVDDPDILILDEPTNHLDVTMTEWLEDYLINSGKIILLVTHDRYFLDNICNVIYELSEGFLTRYGGNYGYFLARREELMSSRQASADKARNLLRKELEWIRRMPKARSHKAKYRVEAFDGLKEKASGPPEQKNLTINISTSRLGSKIINLHGISKSFGNKQIIRDFSYNFGRGTKVGIIGANGTGKSTLLNIMTGELQPDNGYVEKGETVVFGYYRQEGISFDEGLTVIEAARKISETVVSSMGKDFSVSQFLTYFLFPPARQHTLLRKLSGGEKRRLYLLTVLMQNPNFLILDEPTNDLDILTLNVLEDYLMAFQGSLVVVSHDRYFLDKLAEYIFEIHEGEVIIYPGNYTRLRLLKEKASAGPDVPLSVSAGSPVSSEKAVSRKANREKRGLTFSEKTELEKLPVEIDTLIAERNKVEKRLSIPDGTHNEISELSERLAELMELIDSKELRWLELTEKAES
ncbi:MAG TPA: ABC-F family ATP-binding cassette domain-containing protein [Bacteroidales bacterium]|nr:ABC-F family ATP-binding cassette domain-containing protein [Bacteroidales bacterium]